MLVYLCVECGNFGLLSGITGDEAWGNSHLTRCLKCNNDDIDYIERLDLEDAKNFDTEPKTKEEAVRQIELRALQLVTTARHVDNFEKLNEMLKRLRSCFTV